ncbi:MAG: glycogen synthase GlgA [Halothiobacillaceae bacterium]|nr:MAG: glycogen synthase GlgA [Halothiobacillaceae bacterium]
MKVLFASSEVHPLMKTGGLGDVSGSLPQALRAQGVDVRIVMPGYADTLKKLRAWRPMCEMRLAPFGEFQLLATQVPGSKVPLILIDHPMFSEQPGNPYNGPDGHAWPDSADRFTLLSRVCELIALDEAVLDWQPDIVHANDWQTGLLLALLAPNPKAPPGLITIHNLVYQGVFDRGTFERLQLPANLWTPDGVEHWGEMNCLKAGINGARFITTVSPSYAREIQTHAFGAGLDGLLRHRHKDVVGILNGIDPQEWDPACDPALPHPFDAKHLDGKLANKHALQQEFDLDIDEEAMLIGMVGRMVDQKGLDLVLHVADAMLKMPVQLAMLGSGDPALEAGFTALMARHPGRVHVRIGYNEGLAHRIEAGSDVFLMPSRFEPCGLNQMYSLRYGTPPMVHGVGGLNDTVVDTTKESLKDGKANGFVMRHLDPGAILWAVGEALNYFRKPRDWQDIQKNGMQADFSWEVSARKYIELYRRALKD